MWRWPAVAVAPASKNRVHLDLRGEVMADEVERLRGQGATVVANAPSARSAGR